MLDESGRCSCAPGNAADENEDCVPCRPELGMRITPDGRCACALERGMVIDERGRCICPVEHGYKLDESGWCVRVERPECETDDDCADDKRCGKESKVCEDPCLDKVCGVNAFCNATRHRAICQCIAGYIGNPDEICSK